MILSFSQNPDQLSKQINYEDEKNNTTETINFSDIDGCQKK